MRGPKMRRAKIKDMLTDYIQAAMRHARYEIIDDPIPFYGSIPECPSVWAGRDAGSLSRRAPKCIGGLDRSWASLWASHPRD